MKIKTVEVSCDRCKNVLDENNEKVWSFRIIKSKRFDLCNSCMTDLTRFLNGQEVAVS